MRSPMQPVLIPVQARWTAAMVVAFSIGLVISSVFTGLSVGLPLGLACCTSSSSFTEYDGQIGPGDGNDLYSITSIQVDSNALDLCKSVCNADSACAYFDFNTELQYCFLYGESEVSAIVGSAVSNVYLKNGYNLPNSG